MRELKQVYFEGKQIKIPVDHFYVAKDIDGSIYSYEFEPTLKEEDGWFVSIKGDSKIVVDKEPTPSWKFSLTAYK